jgi:hypothetical protein
MKPKKKTAKKLAPIHLHIDVPSYNAYAKEQEKQVKEVMKRLEAMGIFEELSDPNR